MSPKNSKNVTISIVAAVVVVVALFVIVSSLTHSPEEPGDVQVPDNLGEVKPVPDTAAEIPEDTEMEKPEKTPEQTPEKTPVLEADIEPDEAPMDPEDQPRQFYGDAFEEYNSLPEGFKTEDVQLTENGIELEPLAPGEDPRPRYGTIESPPQQTDFPSNALSPMWKQDVSEGTSLFVEVTVSPNGEDWGIWHPAYQDDDASMPAEFYPDGRPNPNYGHVPGGVFFWGNRQYNYFRYRVTLYSEVEDSPVLEGLRIFYQDSTLGEGHVPEVTDEEGVEE